MQDFLTLNIFYAWCVLVNGVLYYAEIDFLLHFGGNYSKKLIPHYVIFNTLLTVAAIWTQMFFVFSMFHIAFLFFFSVKYLGIPLKGVVTPAVIIFTLSTFREGFVAVLMQFLSASLTSQALGWFFQFFLPAVLGGLFFLALRLLIRRYPLMNQNLTSSYLYILLLPSALIIGGVRTSLGLDSYGGQFNHGTFIDGTPSSVISALLWMLGTLLVFFVIMEVFHKVSLLASRDKEHALLENQIQKQHLYIEEARQRNESCRSFQHDINNHLLVLSGLISSQKYSEAKEYLEKLNIMSGSLSQEIVTGNSALDVLLWEKIRYAKQHQITVTWDIQIPKDSIIDDVDLCILFANGIDNAIKACIDLDVSHRVITLTARPKHMFLFIEIVNETLTSQPFTYGTGLRNIEFTVTKYRGTYYIEQLANRFTLSMLLCYKKAEQASSGHR